MDSANKRLLYNPRTLIGSCDTFFFRDNRFQVEHTAHDLIQTFLSRGYTLFQTRYLRPPYTPVLHTDIMKHMRTSEALEDAFLSHTGILKSEAYMIDGETTVENVKNHTILPAKPIPSYKYSDELIAVLKEDR